MDINIIEENIKKIKNPIIFLFLLINIKEEISDFYISMILRIFLKYHNNIAFLYNIRKIFINEALPISNNIIKEFYQLIHKKLCYLGILKKFKEIYTNNSFWLLDINQQINFIENKYEHFKSIFDVSKGTTLYQDKLIPLLFETNNRQFILNETVQRLKILIELFGLKLFTILEIPIITINDLFESTNHNIYIYLNMIYKRFDELLSNILKTFENYYIICSKIDNLINPDIVIINQVDSEIDFDLNFDDLIK